MLDFPLELTLYSQFQIIEHLQRQADLHVGSDAQLPELCDPLEESRLRVAKKRDVGEICVTVAA